MSRAKKVKIRPAEEGDVASIHLLIAELAEFESLQHLFLATVEDLRSSLFGENRAAEALVAEKEGEIVAYAIYFPSFSSFVGKAGLWLEDLYVKPKFRGQGVGRTLILAVAKIAEQRGSQRLEWSVLDWNERAIEFYESLGADVMPDWKITRLGREGIEFLVRQGK
jgi:GNAT superfamily N-acetyltransferase